MVVMSFINVERTDTVSSVDMVYAPVHAKHEAKWEAFEASEDVSKAMTANLAERGLPPILRLRVCVKCWGKAE